MAKTLTVTNLSCNATWQYINTIDLQTAIDGSSLVPALSLASGTGLNQCDLMFADTRTVNASSNDDLDLSGSLTDVFGATLAFVKIKAIMVVNTNTTAGDIITVGGDGTAGFCTWLKTTGVTATGGVRIGPNGFFILANPSLAGYAITATTADILRIAEVGGANANTYKIVLLGTSA